MLGTDHSNLKNQTRVISICGVDGSGKTTLIQELKKSQYPTLRSPQVHQSGDFSISSHSNALENLSQHCDHSKDLIQKACVLFLAMSLQPQAQRELLLNPSSLFFRERDPLLDLVVYAPLYLKLLNRETLFQPSLFSDLVKEVYEKQKSLFKNAPLENLPASLIEFFSKDRSVWMKELITTWNITLPHDLILLKGSHPLLKDRMEQKGKGQAKEYHEELSLLLHLQAGFEQAGTALSPLFGFRFHVIDLNENESAEELKNRVLQIL